MKRQGKPDIKIEKRRMKYPERRLLRNLADKGPRPIII